MATRRDRGARARRFAEAPVRPEGRPVPARGGVGRMSGKAQRMFNATEAKNRFGAIMKLVDQSEPVFIEKHGTAHAVVLDIDSYVSLVEKARAPHELKLAALRDEFDELYAAMQTPTSQKGIDALLSAEPAELNAVAARSKSRG